MGLRATIDIGSNSILLLVANFSDDKVTILENESNVTGLGRDLDQNGSFINEAMTDSEAVLEQYVSICRKHKIDPKNIIATATEASRVAKNAKSFYESIKQKYDLSVLVITGEAEAYFSTTGILFDKKINEDIITIMDIGGASTELIKVNTKEQKIIRSFSMPVGAVRMNNWEQDDCQSVKLNSVLADFHEGISSVKSKKLYCVAGTMTSVGSMYLENKTFVENQVNALEFKSCELDTMLKKFHAYSPEEYLIQFPFLGKRSRTIESGIRLAQAIIKKLGVEDLYISTYGLRYGTLLAGEISNDYIR